MNITKYIEKSVWCVDFGEIDEENRNGVTRGIRPALVIHNSMNKATIIPLTMSKFHAVENMTYEILEGKFSVPLYQDCTTIPYSQFKDTFYGIMHDDKFNEIISTYFDILTKKKSISSELMADPDFDKDVFNHAIIKEERLNGNNKFNIDELSSVTTKMTHLQFVYTIIYSLYSEHLFIINSRRYLERKRDSSIGMYFNENFLLIRKNAHKVISAIMAKNRNVSKDSFRELSYAFTRGCHDGYILRNPATNYPEYNYTDELGNDQDIFIILNLNELKKTFEENGIDRIYMIDEIKARIKADMELNLDHKSLIPQALINDIVDTYRHE